MALYQFTWAENILVPLKMFSLEHSGLWWDSKSMIAIHKKNYISNAQKKKDTMRIPTEDFKRCCLQQLVTAPRSSCLTSHQSSTTHFTV